MPTAKTLSRAPADAGDSDAMVEWDGLTTALNRRGVIHLAPERPRRVGVPSTARELFERLALSPESRLQQAAVMLLLTHPHLAADAQAAIDRLDGAARDRAMRRYVAAAALQRMARTRIALQLGVQPPIPAAYVDALGLPSLDEEFGRATLLTMADQEQGRYGYDAWGTYWALLDRFLTEIRRSGWGATCESERIEPA